MFPANNVQLFAINNIQSSFNYYDNYIIDDDIKYIIKYSQGQREKMTTEGRLKKYEKYLGDVSSMFKTKRYRVKVLGIRQIQVEVCKIFNLTTDRASWRTIRGMLGWFCMIWEIKGVPEFVQNKVTFFVANCNSKKLMIHIFKERKNNSFEPLIQESEINELLTSRTKSLDKLDELDFENEIDLFPEETKDIFDF